MIKEFEIVCEATKDYILNSGAKGYEDLKFMSTLSNIIMNEDDKNTNYKFTKKYSLKEIDKIVTSFLEYLNPSPSKSKHLISVFIKLASSSVSFDNQISCLLSSSK